MMFEQMIYVSRAMPDVGARGAYDIIRVAHNRNSRDQLTGMLVFLDGFFLQVLEGRAHHLQARFEVIAADLRHADIEVRRHIKSSELVFPGEWMGLCHDRSVATTTKLAFDYQIGYPKSAFDGDKLLAFALACYADSQLG